MKLRNWTLCGIVVAGLSVWPSGYGEAQEEPLIDLTGPPLVVEELPAGVPVPVNVIIAADAVRAPTSDTPGGPIWPELPLSAHIESVEFQGMSLAIELRLENTGSQPYLLPVSKLGTVGFGPEEVGRRQLTIRVRFDDPDSDDESDRTAVRAHGAESREDSLVPVNPAEAVRVRFDVDVPRMRLPNEESDDYALDIEVSLQEEHFQDGTDAPRVVTQFSEVLLSDNVVRQAIAP